MTYLKEESFLDINKKEIRYESKSILKETYAECKIVRRNGRLNVINKKNPKYKQRQG